MKIKSNNKIIATINQSGKVNWKINKDELDCMDIQRVLSLSRQKQVQFKMSLGILLISSLFLLLTLIYYLRGV